jgi:hypothetical protein
VSLAELERVGALAEHRRYGEVFRHLYELQNALSALARVSANLIDHTIRGLTVGAVTTDWPPPINTDDGDAPEGEAREL